MHKRVVLPGVEPGNCKFAAMRARRASERAYRISKDYIRNPAFPSVLRSVWQLTRRMADRQTVKA